MPHTPPANDYDVVIVGASFGGAACALAAAQYGLRVCVLERKADPGERLHTTGIVVKEAMEQTWLGRMHDHLVQRVARVRLYAPNLHNVLLTAPGYYFLTSDTPSLMRWLASELRASGVDLRRHTRTRGQDGVWAPQISYAVVEQHIHASACHRRDTAALLEGA